MLLAAVCVYQLVESFKPLNNITLRVDNMVWREPGTSMPWRIAYGFGALTFFSLGVRFGKGS